MILGCGGCAIDNALASSSVLGGTCQCVGGMVGGRGGCMTDNTVEAVDGVMQWMTRGLWAEVFGDMRLCCQVKGVGAMGGVVGGRHALVGHDKQQSTKGEREGGGKPLTCWLVLRPCSPGQRWGGQQRLARAGVGLLMHRVTRVTMGGGDQCHSLFLVWFTPFSNKLVMPGPDVIDVRSFLSDVE